MLIAPSETFAGAGVYIVETMAVILQPLLLVILLTCGGDPDPTLAKNCNDTDFILKNGEKQLIKDKMSLESLSSLTVYIKPNSDFQGFFLSVKGVDDTSHGAWFHAEPQCFPPDGKWYELWMRARIKTYFLEFEFRIGNCWKECMKNYNQRSLRSLTLVGYGPSSWLLERPSYPCHVIFWSWSSSLLKLPSCNNISPEVATTPTIITTTPTIIPTTPPYETTTTNASETSSSAWPTWKLPTITAATVAGAVVAAVAVMVVVCLRRKSLTPTTGEPASPSQPTETAMELHTIENELYEPYDKYAATVTSPRHEQPLHVMENDIYEPFSGHGHGQHQ